MVSKQEGPQSTREAFEEFLHRFYKGEERETDPPSAMLKLDVLLPKAQPSAEDSDGIDFQTVIRMEVDDGTEVWCEQRTEEEAICRYYHDYWYALGLRSKSVLHIPKPKSSTTSAPNDDKRGARSVRLDGPVTTGLPTGGRHRKHRQRLLTKLSGTRDALRKLRAEFEEDDGFSIPGHLWSEGPLPKIQAEKVTFDFDQKMVEAFDKVDRFLKAQETRFKFTLECEPESRKRGGRPPADLAKRRLIAQLLTIRKGVHRSLSREGEFWGKPEYGPVRASEEVGQHRIFLGPWGDRGVQAVLGWRADVISETGKPPTQLLSHHDVALLLAATNVEQIEESPDTPFDERVDHIADTVVGNQWHQIRKDLESGKGLDLLYNIW